MNGECHLEHLRGPEPLAELAQERLAAGRDPELRSRLLACRTEPERPDPGDDVAPVVEVEVRQADRVDARPVLELSELREHPRAAVQEHSAIAFDQVAGLGPAGIGPRRRASDDRELHFHSVAYPETSSALKIFPIVRIPILRAVAGQIRVVIAKPGLDGHDRGAKIIARALRDAGMEVIYTGLHQTPEQIVETAIQEDADAVGVSVLSGAHMTLFARLGELMADRGIDDVVVFGGGIIPEEDIPELERLGVAHIFTPGATTTEIVEWVREHVGSVA